MLNNLTKQNTMRKEDVEVIEVDLFDTYFSPKANVLKLKWYHKMINWIFRKEVYSEPKWFSRGLTNK